MYSGSYRHSLDTKGRVALPARYRSKPERAVVVMPWAGKELLIIDVERWPEFSAALKQARLDGRLSSAKQRVITGEAKEEVPDAQGRIPIPQGLRTYAEIDREVWFIGDGDRIHVVAAGRYDRQRSEGFEGLAQDEDIPV